jgi:hypothetical protein
MKEKWEGGEESEVSSDPDNPEAKTLPGKKYVFIRFLGICVRRRDSFRYRLSGE